MTAMVSSTPVSTCSPAPWPNWDSGWVPQSYLVHLSHALSVPGPEKAPGVAPTQRPAPWPGLQPFWAPALPFQPGFLAWPPRPGVFSQVSSWLQRWDKGAHLFSWAFLLGPREPGGRELSSLIRIALYQAFVGALQCTKHSLPSYLICLCPGTASPFERGGS